MSNLQFFLIIYLSGSLLFILLQIYLIGNANFDTDFFYWLLVYNRKPMYDKELNEKYTTMYKKYYCGAVKNYLK